MIVSIECANKEVKLLNEYKARLLALENSNKAWVSTDVDKEADRPEYDFKDTQEKIMKTVAKICDIKHKVNLFNISHVLPCGLTVDSALVRMTMLNDRANTLSRLSMMSDKIRMTHVQGEGKLYQYRNFDAAEAEAELTVLQREILTIQTQINEANLQNHIEIE